MASAFDLISGTYVTIYNRADDPQGALFWANSLGFSSLAAASAPGTATLALADQLGKNFYAASGAAFDALYPNTGAGAISDSQFINQLYLNLGGIGPDGQGANFWGNRLTVLEASNSQQVARAIVATEIAFTLQTFDPNATGDAKVRAQTYQNKIAVAEATATTGNASFNPASQSLTDPAYKGLTNVLVGVTDTSASLNVALAQVQAANAANNPSLMVGQNAPLTLTAGVDSPTEGFTSGHGAVATAPGAVFTANPVSGENGLNNSLNTGDNLQDSFGDGTLNLTSVLGGGLGFLGNPGFAAGVTMNGISTLNVTNQGSLLGLGVFATGFQGNVTGLQTVNVGFNGLGSIAGVQLGNVNQGLNTPLKTVNINQFAGNPLIFGLFGALPVFSADIAQSAASAANSLTINLNGNLGRTSVIGAGIPIGGGAATISIANDGAAGTAAAPNLSYGTQIYNTGTNTKTYLQLEAQPDGFLGGILGALGVPSVDGTTTFKFTGAGELAVGQDIAGDHQFVQDIDASGTTGHVVITGATAGTGTTAYATTANPGALYGSTAGFLDNTGTTAFNLTKFELGSGTTFLDVSSATGAQVKALTTTPGTLVALDNEIVVKDAAAKGANFGGIKGFSILGIGGSAFADGAGGTIDLANLTPAGLTTIDFVTLSSAATVFNNQTVALTVNTYDNGNGNAITVGAVGPASGTTDVFTLKLGNAAHNDGNFGPLDGAGSVGAVTLFGDEVVNFIATGQTATGVPGIVDTIGFVALTPSTFGNEKVTISGTTALNIGVGTGLGAIADWDGTALLNQNNMGIVDTNTGVTTFGGATGGGTPLFFVPFGSDNGIALGYSTNALTIDASTSGGLIMQAGDANYSFVTNLGDQITGSTTASNALAGSLGNDTFKATFGTDTIATNGGADTINISGHTGPDHIDLYTVSNTLIAPGGDYNGVANTTTNGVVAFGFGFGVAGIGSWGIGTTGAPIDAGGNIFLNLLANGFSTSSSLSVVTGFNATTSAATTDVISFSTSGWGTANGLLANDYLGLVNSDNVRLVAANATFTTGVIAGTNLLAGTSVIELGNTFTNVQAVANFFDTAGINLHTALGAGTSADYLVAWQDTANNTHISDLHLLNTGAATKATATMNVAVSDMVQLTGVTVTSLNAADFHIVA
jgi:hypothetical protein